MLKLLMGNEAIALGAIKAGVNVVCGYPGTPSTEVLETVAKHNDGSIYVEWSVNEKTAMEVGAGAAYSGARTMVTMKQVGLNVASDPLMSLAYIGVKGGMVILVADDPGPLSSQTEQDTRHFAKYSNLPVLDPTTPEEAYEMIQYAFELSEQVNLPVFMRPTTRICHACAAIDITDDKKINKPEGFVKDPKWVIFPSLAYKRHIEIEKLQNKLSEIFDQSRFNSAEGKGSLGIAASGIGYAYACDAIKALGSDIKVLKIGTPYPFPKTVGEYFLKDVDKVLVLEELDPVVEEALLEISAQKSIPVKIMGKKDGTTPCCGEFSFELIYGLIAKLLGKESEATATPTQPATVSKEGSNQTVPKSPGVQQHSASKEAPTQTAPTSSEAPAPQLPSRPPVLCAGCPHRASFYAVKKAMKGKKAVFTGDIGCYTLGNAKPLNMVDTCLCMGASISVAQGIKRVEPDTTLFAFIGDSTFFHTGIPGIINAVYNQTNLVLVVLDNSTTAMTGHQPHPGIAKTMMGNVSEKISISAVLKAIGIKNVWTLNPFDQKAAINAVKEASQINGVSAIVFEAPCIAIIPKPQALKVNSDKCKACGLCIKEVGCPSQYVTADKKVHIEPSTCYACGLCKSVCAFDSIGGDL